MKYYTEQLTHAKSLDSRGNPTLSVTLNLVHSVAVSSELTGEHEELRDRKLVTVPAVDKNVNNYCWTSSDLEDRQGIDRDRSWR